MASKELDKSKRQKDKENIKIYSEKDQNVETVNIKINFS